MRSLITLLLLTLCIVSAQSQNVRISQIYGAGGTAGASYKNDYVELFNPTASTVNLSGWSIQYTSNTGASWLVTPLIGSIAPGKYYLIQLAGGSNGANLPTADATGATNMASNSGKLALTNSTTTLSSICPVSASIIDFVGFGTGANCFEGAAPATAPGSTTAIFRSADGCVDNNNNSIDFFAATTSPRNSASAFNSCVFPVFLSGPPVTGLIGNTGTGSASGTYTLQASNLIPATGSITITPSAGVEVSATNSNFSASGITIPYTGGTIPSTIIYVRLGATAGTGVFSGAVTHTGGGASANILSVSGTVYTNYYNTKPGGNGLNDTATWSTTLNGSGPSPVNFVNDYQIFNIVNQSNAFYTGVWDVSSSNGSSKVVVGDGNSMMLFDILSDADSVTSRTKIDVSNNGYLVLENNRIPTIGNIAVGSTIDFFQAGTTSADTIRIPALSYYNLNLTGGLKYFSAGTTTVRKDLSVVGAQINGWNRGSQSTVIVNGDVVFAGGASFDNDNTNPNNAADNARFILSMEGTSGFQSILSDAPTDVRLFRLQRGPSTPLSPLIIDASSSPMNFYLGTASGGGLTLNENGTNTTEFDLGTNMLVFNSGSGSVVGSGKLYPIYGDIVIKKSSGSANLGTLLFTPGSLLNNFTIDFDPAFTRDSVILGTDVTVVGSLNLNKGKLVVTTGKYLYMDGPVAVNGGSSSSFVDGEMAKTGADPFTFPIGKGSKYAPMGITNLATYNTYYARYVNTGYGSYGIAPATTSVNPNFTVSQKEYWTINSLNVDDSTDVLLYYNDGTFSTITDPAKTMLAVYYNASWNNLGNTGFSGNATAGYVRANVPLFGPITFGKGQYCGTIPSAPSGTDASRCGNGTVTISATAGTDETIDWYATATGGTALATGTTSFATPSISTNTTYFAEARNSFTACVSSTRTAVQANIYPSLAAPQAVNASRCGAGSVTISATVGANETVDWYAAATGGTALATGTTSFTTPSLSVSKTYYAQTRSLTVGCTSSARTAVQAIIVNAPALPSGTGASRCGNGTLTISATASAGETIDWYASATGGTALQSGSSSFTTPVISSTTTYYAEARNIATGCLSAARTAVTATINIIPSAPTGSSASRCGNGTLSFTAAVGSSVTVDWYDAAAGGNLLLSGSTSFTTPTLSTTTTYYAEARNTSSGCLSSSRTAFVATINPQPSAASGTGASRCGAGTLTISATASAGETIDWYTVATGGTAVLSNSLNYTTPVISVTTTYYAEARNTTTGCVSATRTAVLATVNALPAAPTGTGASRCGAGTVTLSATAPSGSVVDWYATASGGTALASGSNNFTTPSISINTLYYAESRNTSCGGVSSTRTAVLATVNNLPAAASGTNGSRCGTGSVTLLASASGNAVDWYAASSGGSSLGTGTTFNTPSISTTTTFYAESRVAGTGCVAASRTAVIANVIPSPNAPTGNNAARCGTGTVTISASASVGETIDWYADATGGTPLVSGAFNFTTPVISTTTTYYAQARNSTTSCTSATRTAVTATVNPAVVITSQPAASQNVCTGSTVVLSVTATGSVQGYQWRRGTTNLTDGANVSGSQTATLTLSNITVSDIANNYNVVVTGTGTCTSVTSNNSQLVVSSITAVASAAPIACYLGTTFLTVSATGGTAPYQYSLDGINYQLSDTFNVGPGVYSVKITDAHNCTAVSNTVSVTAPSQLAPLILAPQIACYGGTTTITTIVNGGTAPYQYSLNGNTYQSSNTFDVGPGIYSVTVKDANNCTAVSNTILRESPQQLAPVLLKDPMSCSATITTLHASAIGGTGSYQFSLNGGAFQSVSDFVVSAGTYSVTVRDDNGCTAVSNTVIVRSPLTAIAIQGDLVHCYGDSADVIAATQGGVEPYSYSLDGTSFQSSNTFRVPAGLYSVIVKDDVGCTFVTNAVLITQPDPLTFTYTIDSINCNGGTAVLKINATGGNPAALGSPDYHYNIEGSPDYSSALFYIRDTFTLTAGYYNVTVRSIAGCVARQDSIHITQPDSLVVNAVLDSAIRCGTTTTTVRVTASGGTAPYTGTGTFTVTAGTNNFTVTDAYGCSSVASVTVAAATDNIAPVIQTCATSQTVNAGATTQVPLPNFTSSVTATDNCSSSLIITQSPAAGTLVAAGTTNVTIYVTDGSGNTSNCTTSFTVTSNCSFSVDTIAGNKNACSYMGAAGDTAIYTIAAVNAASYTWSWPTGTVYVSGQGTNKLRVKYATSFVTGNISVTVNGNCGSPVTRSITITKSAPAAPSAVFGPNTVCTYMGTSTVVTYSIAPVPNAISYLWTVPANVSIVGPNNGLTLQVTFSSAFIGGNITVKAVSGCGSSVAKVFALTKNAPPTPGTITGPVDVCPIMGTANTATYTIRKVNFASSYNWVIPAGATATHPAGAGINDTIVVVSFDNTYITSVFSVNAVNDCGMSVARTLTVSKKLPTTPGLISGPTDACPLMGLDTTVYYTIKKVKLATSYTWNVPTGASIVSHPGGAGVDDTIIGVQYLSNFVNGAVTVIANANCGSSPMKSLAILRRIPATPGAISGPTDACPLMGTGQTVTYSITPVLYATSYIWTMPAGATLISGQGTTSIVVSYDNSFTLGSIVVQSKNNCWISTVRTLAITRKLPALPGTISASTPTACPNRQVTYTILPTLNTNYYKWTVPAGAVIVSGDSTTSITVQYQPGAVSDTVRVRSVNNCAMSAERKLKITLSACPPTSVDMPVAKATTVRTSASIQLDLTAMPNPSQHQFNITVKSTDMRTPVMMLVTDMTGKLLETRSGIMPGQQIVVGSAFHSGMYMAEFIQGDIRRTIRLVKL